MFSSSSEINKVNLMEPVTLKECVFVEDEKLYRNGDYARATFRLESGTVITGVGQIGFLHELCTYTLVGYYESTSVFQIKTYGFDPCDIDLNCLMKCGAMMVKTNPRFNMVEWNTRMHNWNGIDDDNEKTEFYKTNLENVIRYNARYNAALNYWIDPQQYKHLYMIYNDIVVFSWQIITVEKIMRIFHSKPYSLCFDTPTDEMHGIVADVNVLESLIHKDDINPVLRSAAELANTFFGNCLKITKDAPQPMLLENNFLCEQNGMYARGLIVDMVDKIKQARRFTCTGWDNMVSRLEQIQHDNKDVVFLTPKDAIFDSSRFGKNMRLNTGLTDQTSSVVFVAANAWSIFQVASIMERVPMATFILVALRNGVPGSSGYNLMNVYEKTTVMPTLPELHDINKSGSKNVLFEYRFKEKFNHYDMSVLTKQFSTSRKKQRMLFVTDDNELLRGSRLRSANDHFEEKERVVYDNEAVFVDEIYDLSPNTKKRKRSDTSSANDSNMVKKMVLLSNHKRIEWYKIRKMVKKWQMQPIHVVASLQEDVLFYVTSSPKKSTVEALMGNAKKLVVVTPDGTVIKDDSSDAACFCDLLSLQ